MDAKDNTIGEEQVFDMQSDAQELSVNDGNYSAEQIQLSETLPKPSLLKEQDKFTQESENNKDYMQEEEEEEEDIEQKQQQHRSGKTEEEEEEKQEEVYVPTFNQEVEEVDSMNKTMSQGNNKVTSLCWKMTSTLSMENMVDKVEFNRNGISQWDQKTKQEFWSIWSTIHSREDPKHADGVAASHFNKLLREVFCEDKITSAQMNSLPQLSASSTMDTLAEVLTEIIGLSTLAIRPLNEAFNIIFFRICEVRNAVWITASTGDSHIQQDYDEEEEEEAAPRLAFVLEQLFMQNLHQIPTRAPDTPDTTQQSDVLCKVKCSWAAGEMLCPIKRCENASQAVSGDEEETIDSSGAASSSSPLFSVMGTTLFRQSTESASNKSFCERNDASDHLGPMVTFVLRDEGIPLAIDEVRPSIFSCAERGDLAGLYYYLVTLKVDPDIARCENGDTCLIIASANNQIAAIRFLLDCGANKTKKNHRNDQPLNLAIRYRFSEVTEVLSYYKGQLPEELRIQAKINTKKQKVKKIDPLANWKLKTKAIFERREKMNKQLPKLFKVNLNPREVCTPENSPILTVNMDNYVNRAKSIYASSGITNRATLPEFKGASRVVGGSTILTAQVEIPRPAVGGETYSKPQLAQTQSLEQRSTPVFFSPTHSGKLDIGEIARANFRAKKARGELAAPLDAREQVAKVKATLKQRSIVAAHNSMHPDDPSTSATLRKSTSPHIPTLKSVNPEQDFNIPPNFSKILRSAHASKRRLKYGNKTSRRSNLTNHFLEEGKRSEIGGGGGLNWISTLRATAMKNLQSYPRASSSHRRERYFDSPNERFSVGARGRDRNISRRNAQQQQHKIPHIHQSPSLSPGTLSVIKGANVRWPVNLNTKDFPGVKVYQAHIPTIHGRHDKKMRKLRKIHKKKSTWANVVTNSAAAIQRFDVVKHNRYVITQLRVPSVLIQKGF